MTSGIDELHQLAPSSNIDELPNPYENWKPDNDFEEIADAEPYDEQEHGASQKVLTWPPSFEADFYDQMRAYGVEPEDIDDLGENTSKDRSNIKSHINHIGASSGRRHQYASEQDTEALKRVWDHLQESKDEAVRETEAWVQEVGLSGQLHELDSCASYGHEFVFAPQRGISSNITRNGGKVDVVQYVDDFHNWPARLLHVPTMTSLEWQPIGTYGNHKSPAYIALSYTWGRWKLDRKNYPWAPALHVSGMSWDIPPVDESLFTVKRMQSVLDKITQRTGIDFVWLDVACIDQRENSAQGALEIGRQAKIFRGAEHVFIWLLADQLDPLHRTLDLHLGIIQHISLGLSPYHEHEKPVERSDSWYMDASASIAELTSIPWWSSLWTLQEAFIRPDAFLLDSDGNCATTADSNEFITLQSVLENCASLYVQSFDPKEERYTTRDPTAIDQILVGGLRRVVEKSGIHALAQHNPLVLYTCAKTRKTLRPLDRVYGIMQIFDFRLGESAPGADLSKEWTLEELETQLGQQLVEKFPVESQLHVHRDSILGRQAWRISSNSTIPDCFKSMPFNRFGLLGKLDGRGARLETRIKAGVTHGWFQGEVCAFECWAHAVHKYDRKDEVRDVFSLEPGESAANTALDNVIRLLGLEKPKIGSKYSLENPPRSTTHALNEALCKTAEAVRRKFFVALLCMITPEEEATAATGIGLIFMEAMNSSIGPWWKRLGVCTWKVLAKDVPLDVTDVSNTTMLSGHGNAWTTASGLFG